MVGPTMVAQPACQALTTIRFASRTHRPSIQARARSACRLACSTTARSTADCAGQRPPPSPRRRRPPARYSALLGDTCLQSVFEVYQIPDDTTKSGPALKAAVGVVGTVGFVGPRMNLPSPLSALRWPRRGRRIMCDQPWSPLSPPALGAPCHCNRPQPRRRQRPRHPVWTTTKARTCAQSLQLQDRIKKKKPFDDALTAANPSPRLAA